MAAGPQPGTWRLWIDTGGTFTDALGIDPSGALRRAKVLSSAALRGRVLERIGPERVRINQSWGAGPRALVGMALVRPGAAADAATVTAFDPKASVLSIRGPTPEPGELIELRADEEAPILCARLLTDTPPGGTPPPIAMRLGTTRGTNALLERRGGRVALFLTRGHGDLLEIGTQQRPDLFALDIRKPAPLHERIVEVPGRLGPDGAEIEPLDLAAVEVAARSLLAEGVDIAAVALLHAWANPAHEHALGDLLRSLGFRHVSLSSALAPMIRILPRAQTAVVNAYLSPVIDRYLSRIAGALRAGEAGSRAALHVMTSAGGLVGATEFRPKDSLLSGPAGGVVGAAAAGRAAGFDRIIAFDMGGTSTDVSRYDGGHAYVFEHEVGGASIVAPALAIESVAAGGGSICGVEDGRLTVGPRSAGADPGPACYGAGGPLTVTDCNLLLGRIDPRRFGVPLDEAAARRRLAELVAELDHQTDTAHDPDEVLEGLVRIADERMAAAIAQVSIKQGYDPASYALVCFGGAGGQHACAVARRLGIRRIVVPPDAGLLSAAGLGAAAIERFAERQVLQPLDTLDLRGLLRALEQEAAQAVGREGVDPASIAVTRRVATIRLAGQETSLAIDLAADPSNAEAAAAFVERYRAVYGDAPPDRPIEVEALRVIAAAEPGPAPARTPAPAASAELPHRRRLRVAGRWVEAVVMERDSLTEGTRLAGPALILEQHTTTFVDHGWTATVAPSGALVLTDGGAADSGTLSSAPAAARDEIAAGRLLSIARDMGEMLRRTALSVNVKERLDFSCAILDASGHLAVNAPHIPVHLGALGVCVRRLREVIEMGPGDSVVTNHPAFGGSHLPDVTVVTPVFAPGGTLIGYVASRAHHAEIGGSRPGSMPTDARTLAEEGVVIPPMHLVRAGRANWEEVERLLSSGPYPSRTVADNLADLRAQLAATLAGAAALAAFARDEGPDIVHAAMASLADRAARGIARARAALAARPGPLHGGSFMDDGSPIRVRIDASGPRLVIDWTGSAPVHPGNLNATAAIVRSAVIYVLRLLVNEPLPLNEGFLRDVDLRIPTGMLNPEFPHDPALCPAVAGGNVETSQRLVDTMIRALGLAASSQGTMNNLIFGNERFGFYETVCGGAGAGPGFRGASAVHTHMTNTRITDAEILERRYAVRLERFAVRRGSGGRGHWPGGDGVVRELRFLAPCSLSLLTQHRTTGPAGAAGGLPGAPGRQHLIRADGTTEVLPSIAGAQVHPGDRLILETPGGGGWGVPDQDSVGPVTGPTG